MKPTPSREQLLKTLELLEPEDSRWLRSRFGVIYDIAKSIEKLNKGCQLSRDEILTDLHQAEGLARV